MNRPLIVIVCGVFPMNPHLGRAFGVELTTIVKPLELDTYKMIPMVDDIDHSIQPTNPYFSKETWKRKGKSKK